MINKKETFSTSVCIQKLAHLNYSHLKQKLTKKQKYNIFLRINLFASIIERSKKICSPFKTQIYKEAKLLMRIFKRYFFVTKLVLKKFNF